MRILLIDNYDSFVYNIVGLLQRCRRAIPSLEWEVVRNDAISIGDAVAYDAVILSPGPGIPSEAGRLLSLIGEIAGQRPILGICLGCQAIAEHFGCSLHQLEHPRHGHRSRLTDIDSTDPIVGFMGMNSEKEKSGMVGRYHSWVIDEKSITPSTPLIITSRDEEGNIMSIRHKALPVYGLQFHPESIISSDGLRLLFNFLPTATDDRT